MMNRQQCPYAALESLNEPTTKLDILETPRRNWNNKASTTDERQDFPDE